MWCDVNVSKNKFFNQFSVQMIVRGILTLNCSLQPYYNQQHNCFFFHSAWLPEDCQRVFHFGQAVQCSIVQLLELFTLVFDAIVAVQSPAVPMQRTKKVLLRILPVQVHTEGWPQGALITEARGIVGLWHCNFVFIIGTEVNIKTYNTYVQI